LRSAQTASVTVQIVPGAASRTLAPVPVEIRNLENGLRARVAPGTVSLQLRGTDEALRALTAASMPAFVDAAGLSAGERDVEVQVRGLPGVTIASVSPRTVRLRVGSRD
jgi:YbbR domain-containing protein